MWALFVFMIAPVVIFIFIRLLPHIDANPRAGGSEWHIRASESGKTWEIYRYVGNGLVERYTRFKSPAAAEAFVVSKYGDLKPKVAIKGIQ